VPRLSRSRPAARRRRLDPATVGRIFDGLDAQHPSAWTELDFRNPYELLVATILSAQCTDARVNQVTPALFGRYPTAVELARATQEELEPQIQATGFFRMKAKSLRIMAQALVERHDGGVPADMAALVKLPGVGRKTANVVLGHALGVPGLPVDRHVLRVVNRLGLVHSNDPEVVEAALTAALPPARWTRASDALILHGRRVCRPRPLCDRCRVRADCGYFRRLGAKAGPRASGARPKAAGPRPKADERPMAQGPRAKKRSKPGPLALGPGPKKRGSRS
jgi:endonuclease III